MSRPPDQILGALRPVDTTVLYSAEPARTTRGPSSKDDPGLKTTVVGRSGGTGCPDEAPHPGGRELAHWEWVPAGVEAFGRLRRQRARLVRVSSL